MSSLIGDPIWPVLHHIAGTVGAVVRHVWSGIVAMDAGDWAGWAQAAGAVIAIIVAFRQGHADTRARLDDRMRAEADDRNNRVINYEIAVDVFKSITDHADEFILVVENGLTRIGKSADPLFTMNANLAILDRLMVDRLPSTNAAIEIQTMRLMGYEIRSDMQMLLNTTDDTGPNAVPLGIRKTVGEAIALANIDRRDDGPSDMAAFRRRFDTWRLAPAPEPGA